MPNKLTIHADVAGSSTVSKFALAKNDSIELHNDTGATATFQFMQTTPLCEGGVQRMVATIPAGGSKTYQICAGSEGKTFQYQASVAVTGVAPEPANFVMVYGAGGRGGSLESTPIVIFEREVVIGIFAAVVGFAIGYAVARMRGRSH